MSSGLRAVVGMIPEASGRAFPDTSGGFNLRTSSRSSCRILAPRTPSQPEAGRPSELRVGTATPAEDRPYNSIDVTPTIVNQSKSLSSLPSSEASEYIIEEMGSEYDVPIL